MSENDELAEIAQKMQEALPELASEPKEPEPVEEQQPEYSEIEKQALATGWNPDGVKGAEEWVRSEPLYKEIKKRGEELKELKATVDALKSFSDQQRALGAKEALEKLKQDKRTAIEFGDVEQVDRIEQEIKKHEGQGDARDIHIQQFLQQNESWMKDPSALGFQMRDYFEKRDADLTRFNLPVDQHVKMMQQDMENKFPEYFNKSEAEGEIVTPVIESGQSSLNMSKPKKAGIEVLPSEHRKIFKKLEALGVITLDQYIKDLRDLGEIK